MTWNSKLLSIIILLALLEILNLHRFRILPVEKNISHYSTANLTIMFNYTRSYVAKQPRCPQYQIVGPLSISMATLSFEEVQERWSPLSNSTSGRSPDKKSNTGQESCVWRPTSCDPAVGVAKGHPFALHAIILPYRNRKANLTLFLNHMHPFLRHQNIAYAIFVIEQNKPTLFNRAALFNIGYREAMEHANFTCFIFHDVDLLPEDDRNKYFCQDQPLHLSVAVDKFDYNLLYSTLFGGAVAMTESHFQLVKGFANVYYGWGAEDDDMSLRLEKAGLNIARYPLKIARYTMLRHNEENGNQPNPLRHKVLSNAMENLKTDTFETLRYSVLSQGNRFNGLFYHVKVNLLHPLPKSESIEHL